jgi:hypothetical protein
MDSGDAAAAPAATDAGATVLEPSDGGAAPALTADSMLAAK